MGIALNTRKRIQKQVDNHESFKEGNIRANRYNIGDYIPMGRLPNFLQSQLSGLNLDYDVYVVYSYATPIGWLATSSSAAKWFIPEITYSVSTTHHQNLLRVMTDNPGFYSQFS